MRCKIRRLLLVCAMALVGLGANLPVATAQTLVEELTLAPENPQEVTLSFILSPKARFTAALLDALKSGQKLAFKYDVRISLDGWVWSRTLARGRLLRQASYTHRTDEFTLSEQDINQFFLSEPTFVEQLLQKENVLVKADEPLHPGQAVTVAVDISFAPVEDTNWLDWLSLSPLWRTHHFEQKEVVNVRR